MRTVRQSHPEGAMVRAVLRGGPDDLADDQRTCFAPADCDKIKLVHRGGYEHFEREAGGSVPVVYRWTTRTKMAE